jgi:CubicO group peptidase (beta-lactamase class C family)
MDTICKRAEDLLRRLISHHVAPGIQYGLFDGNGPQFLFAGGMADLQSKRAVSPATPFMAYSVTKTFTAVAVLMLVERGLLALDQPVSAVLRDFPYGDEVLVRHLLSQTSGLPNPIPLRWVHKPAAHDSFDEAQVLARIAQRHPHLVFPAGTRYGYSNLAYWYLGAVIERVSGLRYHEFMREQVFAPLGADLTFTTDADIAAHGYLERWSFLNLVKGFVTDHVFWGPVCRGWREILPHYPDGAAFGGLIGPAREIGKFLTDFLKPQSVLLGCDTKNLFLSAQTANGRAVPMTLGWHVAAGFLFKEGGGAGFHAEMRLYPRQGLGSVILTNATGFDAHRRLGEVDGLFL